MLNGRNIERPQKAVVTLRVPEDLKGLLGRKAAKDGQSVNATILILIQKALEKERK